MKRLHADFLNFDLRERFKPIIPLSISHTKEQPNNNLIINFMQQLVSLVKQHLNMEINPHQAEQFRRYSRLLLEWNEKYNLTAITDPGEILIKHFYDSLTCLQSINQQAAFSLVDVGTGAGFPGLPLKIMRPEMSLTMVEAVKKKANFCSAVAEELQLSRVQVLHARAEEAGRDAGLRENFDYATARALADLSVLAEFLLPLVNIGGRVLCLKGKQDQREIQAAQAAISILGGEWETSIPSPLPDDYGQRCIYVIRKKEATPPNFPRRTGLPAKRPIGV